MASSAVIQGAHQESAETAPDQELGQMSQASWHMLDPATRRRTFYKYERRIRDFSQPDKVFHYFASRTLEDGTRQVSSACSNPLEGTDSFTLRMSVSPQILGGISLGCSPPQLHVWMIEANEATCIEP